LVICDRIYAEKADARKAGVGTESQIISQEVYQKVEQSKFIPIVCEFTDDSNPFLPTFLKSRIWIDFSSPEKVNDNWEQLIRLLFGKPLHQKPKLGQPPAYITNETAPPSNPAITKFNALRQALMQDKKGLSIYRKEFLAACISYADSLRVREKPNVDSIGKKILEDCNKLKDVRNHIIDWVLLESDVSKSKDFCEALLNLLESLNELKSRPQEITTWNSSWFEAHSVFVYETFLYIIAALLKTNSYEVLHEVFTTHYLHPITERYSNQNTFDTFSCFYGYSETLQSVFAQKNQSLISPTGELIKNQADRNDLPFSSIIEAELLTLLMAFLNTNVRYWYPQTYHYTRYNNDFPFFIRATQHKYYLNLATITGIASVEELRAAVKEGFTRFKTDSWQYFHSDSFWSSMNMDKLDSLK
jgi:hypothetical protein